MTIDSRQAFLATWKLLFYKTRTFANFLAQFRITPNKQTKHEMRDEVLSNLGTKGKDTSGYQVSTIEDIKFHGEDPDLNLEAFFWPRIHTQLSLIFWRFWDGFNGRKSDSDWRNAIQGEFSSSNNFHFWGTNPSNFSNYYKESYMIFLQTLSFEYDCMCELNEKIVSIYHNHYRN